MNDKHLVKQLDREIDSLRSALGSQVSVRNQIVDWLEGEIEDGQEIVDAKDNHEEAITSDGTDDIIYGRHECATSLLNQIQKFEEE
jgi:hypothetical protein